MGLFQSTPACERATRGLGYYVTVDEFQSTPACERATLEIGGQDLAAYVSIHARL